MTRVTLGKSRVREIRPPGSVRAKAEWLSYSTTILALFWSLLASAVSHPFTGEIDAIGVVNEVAMISYQ